MDHSDFFWLRHGDEAAESIVLTQPMGYKLSCAITRGEQVLEEPLRLQVPEDGTDTFLRSNAIMLNLFSRRFIDLLKRSGLTGWRAYGISSVGRGGDSDVAYAGLAITVRSGDIDNSLSPTVRRQHSPQAPASTYYVGQFFQLNTWDGSDIFLPGKALFSFVTRRLVDAVRDTGIEGFSFKPISEIERLD